MNNEESSGKCQDAQISQIDTKSTNFKINGTDGTATWKDSHETTISLDLKDLYCLEYFGELDMAEDEENEDAGYST